MISLETIRRYPKYPTVQPDRYLELFEKLSRFVGSHDIKVISSAACDLLSGFLQVDACSILLHDPLRDTLVIRSATHIAPDEWESSFISTREGICGRVFTTGKPLLLRKASDFLPFSIQPSRRYGRPSCVAVPLISSSNGILGVINIANPRRRRPFNERDLELIEAAARLISAGLENARLFDQTVQLHRRLEEIFDSFHVAAVALDPRLHVIHYNHRFMEMFHLGPRDSRGSHIGSVIDTPLFNVCGRLLRELSPTVSISEERFEWDDGAERRMISISASRVQGPGPGGGVYLLMIDDIAQEEEVRRLKEADSLKRAFLRIISHELRTPLTVLQGTIPLLQGCCQKCDGSMSERLAQVERLLRPNVQRLSGVVNSILDVVDIENGKLELLRGPLDINKIIQERVVQLYDTAMPKKIEWSLELDPELPIIAGDRQRLRQIFYELMDNAIKFSDTGGTIRVRTARQGPYVAIWFSNRGEPIAQESRPQVFERFYQLDQDLTRKSGGCGLGLFLTQNVARLHGGSVEIVDGEPGETVFLLKLPIAVPRADLAAGI